MHSLSRIALCARLLCDEPDSGRALAEDRARRQLASERRHRRPCCSRVAGLSRRSHRGDCSTANTCAAVAGRGARHDVRWCPRLLLAHNVCSRGAGSAGGWFAAGAAVAQALADRPRRVGQQAHDALALVAERARSPGSRHCPDGRHAEAPGASVDAAASGSEAAASDRDGPSARCIKLGFAPPTRTAASRRRLGCGRLTDMVLCARDGQLPRCCARRRRP